MGRNVISSSEDEDDAPAALFPSKERLQMEIRGVIAGADDETRAVLSAKRIRKMAEAALKMSPGALDQRKAEVKEIAQQEFQMFAMIHGGGDGSEAVEEPEPERKRKGSGGGAKPRKKRSSGGGSGGGGGGEELAALLRAKLLACGLRKVFRGDPCVDDKIDAMYELAETNGLSRKQLSGMNKDACSKFKAKREFEKEVGELDTSLIIEGGRRRRRNVEAPTTGASEAEIKAALKALAKEAGGGSEDESEEESEAAPSSSEEEDDSD